MEQDIRDAIEKNLPATVGDVLKKRLTEADSDRRALESASEDVARLRSENEVLKAECDAFNKRWVDINKREAAVASREQAADLVECKISGATQRANDVFRLAEIVFRNPTLKYSRSESGVRPVLGQYGIEQQNVSNIVNGEATEE